MQNFSRSKGRASEANLLVDVRNASAKIPDTFCDHDDFFAKLGSISLSGSSGCCQSCAKMSEVFLLGQGRIEINPKLLPQYIINKGPPIDKACWTAVLGPFDVLRLCDQLVKTRKSLNLIIGYHEN